MKFKNKFVLLILFLILLMTIINSFNVVLANQGSLNLEIKMLRTKTGYGYKFSSSNGSGHSIWKIYKTDNSRYETIYCLKGGPGFGSDNMFNAEPTQVNYTRYFDMRKPEQIENTYKSKLPTDEKYSALMWILDNIYVLEKTNASDEERKLALENKTMLLDSAKRYAEEQGIDVQSSDFDYLTDDDIDVVQQLAIWHYTNSEESDQYHIEDTFELYLNSRKNDETNADYKPLSSSGGIFDNGEERAKACQALFYYLVETPKKAGYNYDYKNVNSNNKPVQFEETNITMQVMGDRYIFGPYKLESTENKDYNLTAKITDGSNSLVLGDVTYLDSNKGPISVGTNINNLVGKEFYISVPNTVNYSQIKFEVTGTYYSTQIEYWSVATPGLTDQPVVLVEKVKNTFTDETIFKPGEFDLALRKFIVKIADQEIKEGDTYTREPKISQEELEKLVSKTAKWDSGTTVEKVHPKNPLPVKTGDVVKYKIRVYNEGNIAGYATEVTDHLPEGLQFIEPGTGSNQSSINQHYGWTSTDGKTVKTSYLKDTKIDAFNGNTLDYEDLEIECKVIAKPGATQTELKNIAEITAHKDEYGNTTKAKDRDSQPNNVNLNEYGETSQQDDDDFERLVLEKAQGKYEIELEKIDANKTSEKLRGAEFEVTIDSGSKKTYTTNTSGKFTITEIPITEAGTQIVTIKETKAPAGYSNQGGTITLRVTTALEDGEYIVNSIEHTEVTSKGEALKGVTATASGNKISIQMKNYDLDLALRKFIISIDGKDVKTGENYTREPQISSEEITKLENGNATLDNGTTAKKVHPKDPLLVKTGDKVIYIIRVYNEGEISGYANKVTDYLPEGLIFVEGSAINTEYGWKNTNGDGKTIETEYLKNKLLNAFDGQNLHYRDLKIECQVVASAKATPTTLKNIAEITEHSDENGDTTVKDRDSQPHNVTTNNYGETSQQDDDDFERLILPQAEGKYELELEKVDSQNETKKLQGANFEIKVDGAVLNETGIYETNAQGKIIIDNIPISKAGTQTVTIKETKAPTGYSNQGGTITLSVTTALENGVYVVKGIQSSGVKNAGASQTTELKGFTANLEGNKIKVQMKNYQLDLALRKFITSIAGKNVANEDGTLAREPKISEQEIGKLSTGTATWDEGTTSEKVHPKDPLIVETGDKVVYTIRVYNEGEIAGYAKKVTDHLPDGLILASNSDINTTYGWKNPNEDGKTIETEYLKDRLLNAFDGKTIHYIDLKIECEVVAKPGETETSLKNIAEITKHSDEYGDETVKDRDSEPGNVNKDTYGEESQEDDDDFERLILEKATGSYELELEKADGQNLNKKLANAEFEITLPNGETKTYTSSEQGKISIKDLAIEEAGEQTITIKETKAPEGYSKSTDIITVKVNTVLEDGKYLAKTIVIDEKTIDSTLTEVKTGKTDLKANIVNGKIYIQMKNYQLDLALRKFIISIAGKELLAENKTQKEQTSQETEQQESNPEQTPQETNTPKYSREPVITDEELEKLANGSASLDDGTTAQKVHSKEPLVVKTGDKVIYIIRVYNEGKIAGYAKKVTDYLPEGLKFLPDSEVNKEYGWTNPNGDGKTIETEHLAEELIEAFDGENLDYKDLKVECQVVAEAGETDKLLKNIAEITKHSDENNDETVEDRDSTPDNVDKDEYEDKSQEDDDDFEDLIVEKAKDGSYNLKLEKINGQKEEEKLAGAEFEITLPDGSTRTLTTDKNGILNITDLPITKLEVQTIKIKETKAPEGYSRSTDVITIKVTTGIENGKYIAKTIKIENEAINSSSKELTAGKTNITASVKDGTIFIKVDNYMLDLALRKFITKVNDTDITNRVPVFTKLSETEFKYEHPKDPVEVAYGNIVTYTLRIFNEGKIAGYASKIKDDLPEGLTFLPDHETNVEYKWKMYTKDGVETENVEEAEYIETDYLAKENEKEENANLLKAFDQETMTMPDYRDVKIAFLVSEPNTSDRIITNIAEITDDRDENNEPVDDIDSTPDNDEPDEDDIDEEKVKVQYFDLSLKKWVSEAIVTCDGKTTVTKTGHTGDENPEPPVKVEIKQNKFNKTTVKFKFVIKVTNEGEIAGYAKELIDYIPQGLRFDPKDNPLWREEDGKVLTNQLKDTLLQPGESAQVEIILTWINGENNLGEKVNWAEIYDDDNEPHSPDIDSTPGNNKPGEDDIDEAPVILSTSTGITPTYVGLVLAVVSILAGGIVLIKKFVI